MSRERLHARLDGALRPEEVARLDRDIAADPALAAEWEALCAVDGALGRLPGHPAPADLAERVLRIARRERRGLLVRIAVPFAAAAAILLAFALQPGDRNGELFTTQEYLDYVWEVDAEAIGSLALDDLETAILEELEAT